MFTSPSQATESRASSPPESPRVSKIILVEKGKNLTGLVKDHYGRINRSLLDLVLTYNPSITDADLILVNQKIRFPEIREESLLMAGPDNTVSVNLGIFPNLGQAEKFAGLPALRPLKTAIIPRKITASQTWYRIEAIGYPSRQEAQAAAAALKDRGILPIFKEQQ